LNRIQKKNLQKIINIDSVSEFNAANNHKTLHLLVTVLDYSKANPEIGVRWIAFDLIMVYTALF